VCGKLRPELQRAYGAACAISDEVAAGLRPGAVPSQLWERARARAEEAGLGDGFMGPPGDQARFVGHGVGLELDELPVLAPGARMTLEVGQVIAVEPKFVLPGIGGVGIEKTEPERGEETRDLCFGRRVQPASTGMPLGD
jgi:Xaa-Pro aminopeptidase